MALLFKTQGGNMKIIEIILYTLKPNSGLRFHNIMKDISIPLHIRYGIDVIDYGNSLHATDSYYLIRAYDSLEHLKSAQEEFYNSSEWRNGPRESIIELIVVSVKSVMEWEDRVINQLRADQ
jgi:hypothetical protein